MTDTASADLERQAEEARARLSDTADELKARMSPGQLMDEVLNQFRGGDGTELLANLKGQARDNPMALALIGSGLAWMMLGSGHQAMPGYGTGYPTGDHRRAYRPGDGDPLGFPGAFQHDQTRSHDQARSANDDGPSLADRATDSVGAAFDAARGSLQDAAKATAEGARGAAESLRQTGSEALGGMRHAGRDVSHAFSDLLEREPLVIGALGFAVGAAMGAALPASELERRHLGAAAAALKEKVDAGMETAKEAAGEVYAAARDEADRQDGDTSIAEKIGAVAKAAGEKVSEVVHPAAESGSGASAEPPASRV